MISNTFTIVFTANRKRKAMRLRRCPHRKSQLYVHKAKLKKKNPEAGL